MSAASSSSIEDNRANGRREGAHRSAASVDDDRLRAVAAADEDRPGGAFTPPEQLVRSGALLEELYLPLPLARGVAGLDLAMKRGRVARDRDPGINLHRLG